MMMVFITCGKIQRGNEDLRRNQLIFGGGGGGG